jgi:hypothetical protein
MSKQVFLWRTGKMGNDFKILMFLQWLQSWGELLMPGVE